MELQKHLGVGGRALSRREGPALTLILFPPPPPPGNCGHRPSSIRFSHLEKIAAIAFKSEHNHIFTNLQGVVVEDCPLASICVAPMVAPQAVCLVELGSWWDDRPHGWASQSCSSSSPWLSQTAFVSEKTL